MTNLHSSIGKALRQTCFVGLFAFSSSLAQAAEAPVYSPSEAYPDLPFSESVAYNGVLYLSGDLGVDASGKLAAGGIGPETEQAMENIKAKLDRHGLNMSNVIKCTAFLADMSEWAAFNEVYVRYFEKGRFPARSALGVSGLAFNARVEVECLAALR